MTALANQLNVKVEHIDRLGVLLAKPKRLKILVGGRASTKSTFVADYILARVSTGESWCCAREYQNSIEDSVHGMLQDEIERLSLPGFWPKRNEIDHEYGGHIFYRGLARNITSLKGIRTHGLWIEEGEATSKRSLTTLTASLRVSALEQQKAELSGTDIQIPEMWITMNRGSAKDAIAQRFLKRAERDLTKYGYYEDDYMIVIEVNYDENPWFMGSGLESERLDDLKTMTTAEYEHKWLGKYLDTVPNAIIETDWFDACIDAHKKLGFDPTGAEVVSHDPNDGGEDDAALAYRHGVVFLDVQAKEESCLVNEACHWALDYALDKRAEQFIWDADGVGAGLREQIDTKIAGRHMTAHAFYGGRGVDREHEKYVPMESEAEKKSKTNKDTFFNRRAQYYWDVRNRCLKTYLAVTQRKYIDPDELISFSSDIAQLDVLRAELCRIPRIANPLGKIQIMSKEQMAQLDPPIDSPNMADSVMMSFAYQAPRQKKSRRAQMSAKNYYRDQT
ncbi:phage terminase large subunit [uncultured Paraglaciecola sp.]|uniref:phage terminase large subunit n=1 Tax=uncultured Paraglaciecola sp. TaxID=1765024 RepID=UPI002624A2BB|nr:phage terminase large subunit [uncultured Paraglaciecola sp.]